jgi:hypothetical protein
MKTYLSTTKIGRIALHLSCALQNGKWAWHLAGIRRELTLS